MDWFVLFSVGIVALMTGFWTGRSLQWQVADTEEVIAANGGADPVPEKGDGMFRIADLANEDAEEAKAFGGSHHARTVRRIPRGHELGSPVSGTLSCAAEDGHGVLRLTPEKGRVYAPAAGRITRLYPMGSAMLLRTDFGAELYLQAGSGVDEMQSGCYRCRVMEREVVRKGALLLEYDLEELRRDGAGTEVTLRLLPADKGEQPGSLTVTDRPYVKAGDRLMVIG